VLLHRQVTVNPIGLPRTRVDRLDYYQGRVGLQSLPRPPGWLGRGYPFRNHRGEKGKEGIAPFLRRLDSRDHGLGLSLAASVSSTSMINPKVFIVIRQVAAERISNKLCRQTAEAYGLEMNRNYVVQTFEMCSGVTLVAKMSLFG